MSREAGRPPPAPERGPGPAAPPRQVRGRASRPGGGGGKRRRQRAGRSAAAAPGQSGTTGWPCGGRRARPRPGRGRLRLTAAPAPARAPHPGAVLPPSPGAPPGSACRVPGGRRGVWAAPPRRAPVGGGGGFVPRAAPPAAPSRRRREAAAHLGAAGGPAGPRPGRRPGRAARPALCNRRSPAGAAAGGKQREAAGSGASAAWPGAGGGGGSDAPPLTRARQRAVPCRGRAGAGLPRRRWWPVVGVGSSAKARNEEQGGWRCSGRALRRGVPRRGWKSCPDSCWKRIACSVLLSHGQLLSGCFVCL